MLHVYNHIGLQSFAKLETYSASVVKSNFGKFGDVNTFFCPLDTPLIKLAD